MAIPTGKIGPETPYDDEFDIELFLTHNQEHLEAIADAVTAIRQSFREQRPHDNFYHHDIDILACAAEVRKT